MAQMAPHTFQPIQACGISAPLSDLPRSQRENKTIKYIAREGNQKELLPAEIREGFLEEKAQFGQAKYYNLKAGTINKRALIKVTALLVCGWP